MIMSILYVDRNANAIGNSDIKSVQCRSYPQGLVAAEVSAFVLCSAFRCTRLVAVARELDQMPRYHEKQHQRVNHRMSLWVSLLIST
jgi:hypothetical protein